MDGRSEPKTPPCVFLQALVRVRKEKKHKMFVKTVGLFRSFVLNERATQLHWRSQAYSGPHQTLSISIIPDRQRFWTVISIFRIAVLEGKYLGRSKEWGGSLHSRATTWLPVSRFELQRGCLTTGEPHTGLSAPIRLAR